jgi:hypothetical protein
MRVPIGYVAAFSLLMVLLTTPATAQDVTGQRKFQEATMALVDWLRTISGSLGPFVTSEKREQLITRLHELNESVYGVEAAKLALLFDLKVTFGSPAENERVQRIAIDITKKVNGLRIAIGGVAVLLREEFRAGGAECEQLLNEAVDERKIWLFRLASDTTILENQVIREELIEEGEAAVRSLRNASLELARVTTRILQ